MSVTTAGLSLATHNEDVIFVLFKSPNPPAVLLKARARAHPNARMARTFNPDADMFPSTDVQIFEHSPRITDQMASVVVMNPTIDNK
jgi:hypothetical protein